MKKMLLLSLLFSFGAFASDLKPHEIKIGLLVNYWSFDHLERVEKRITDVYEDGYVSLHGLMKKISQVGIEVESGCFKNICEGDLVQYTEDFKKYERRVIRVYDNGFVSIRDRLVKISRLKKLTRVDN